MISDEFRRYVNTKLANAEYHCHPRVDFTYSTNEECNYICSSMIVYNYSIIWDFRNSRHLVGTLYHSLA